MDYYTYTPGPPLSSFVASYQYEAGLQPPERALPTGMAELAIDLAGGGLGALIRSIRTVCAWFLMRWCTAPIDRLF